MTFIPEVSKNSTKVPYYEDANKSDGWQGQATDKSLDTLRSEVTISLSRLGALVLAFQKGVFEGEGAKREGYRIHYVVEGASGQHSPGRIDIAALPVRPARDGRTDVEKHKQASLKMALYMLRIALDGTWLLQQLSPGFSALVPFMLGRGDKTISELWSESAAMSNLLPPGDEDFIEGEVLE